MTINPCQFCCEVELARTGAGLHFAETESLIALPTIGCFTLGYSLIVPKKHKVSFAFQTAKEIAETEIFAEKIRRLSEGLFGPTILAEHGSGSPDEPTAACCDHAHFHVIPTPNFAEVLRLYQSLGGPSLSRQSLGQFAHFQGRSYLSLSERKGSWHLWVGASSFPRQWIRRAVTKAAGGDERFDWRLYPEKQKMRQTAQLYRLALAQEAQTGDSQ